MLTPGALVLGEEMIDMGGICEQGATKLGNFSLDVLITCLFPFSVWFLLISFIHKG